VKMTGPGRWLEDRREEPNQRARCRNRHGRAEVRRASPPRSDRRGWADGGVGRRRRRCQVRAGADGVRGQGHGRCKRTGWGSPQKGGNEEPSNGARPAEAEPDAPVCLR
jgi:hypothetical protein